MSFNAPLHVVVSTSTVNNLTIEFVRQYNGFYYLKYLNSYSLFCVPSAQDVRVFDKAPPSCFILFRLKVQSCLVALDLRLERRVLSKHASNLWKGIKINDRHIENAFKTFYNTALYRFNSGQLKIRIIVPPVAPQQPPAQEQLLAHSTFDDFDNSFDGLLRQLFNNGN
ncbi:hypothetical protein F8M41_021101 [Gigaspora margarita]|uniref:Uncharacterized protein n=1 Tax=Gigaspora margarita TaxID=4874 RepID=A0A8H4EJC0_GIGMA|nr:hypothetical protein F8M41_021101 [Gigaspora margarita]